MTEVRTYPWLSATILLLMSAAAACFIAASLTYCFILHLDWLLKPITASAVTCALLYGVWQVWFHHLTGRWY